jgi:hypothetical protein
MQRKELRTSAFRIQLKFCKWRENCLDYFSFNIWQESRVWDVCFLSDILLWSNLLFCTFFYLCLRLWLQYFIAFLVKNPFSSSRYDKVTHGSLFKWDSSSPLDMTHLKSVIFLRFMFLACMFVVEQKFWRIKILQSFFHVRKRGFQKLNLNSDRICNSDGFLRQPLFVGSGRIKESPSISHSLFQI